MGALANVKWELFCQHIITGAKFGLSHGAAYIKAGYNATPGAADVGASRLLKKDKIIARLAELAAPKDAVRRVNVSAQALIDKAERVIEIAERNEELAPMNAAITLQGKLGGALVDRVEIGEAGAFAKMTTPEEVVDAMLLQFDDPREALDAMRKLVEMAEERVSRMATPIDAKPRARPSEANEARAIFKPGRL